MKAAEFAALLSGREYMHEITEAEEARAKALGLVVIFGASDDLAELRGAIYDEIGAGDGTVLRIGAVHGLIPNWESVDRESEEDSRSYHDMVRAGFSEVEVEWAPDDEPLSWRFKTAIPHATFNVMEDGDVFCRGIVFALADVKGGAS